MSGEAPRPLTPGERQIVRTVFGDAVDPDPVRVHRRPWWPLQPRAVCMAPNGDLWFHGAGELWRPDFAHAERPLQALFVHEMTHVWQAQRGGRWFLPLARHPFCRYRYRLIPGQPFGRYGLEQQAEIVKHAWLARQRGAPDPLLEALLPFGPVAPAPETPR